MDIDVITHELTHVYITSDGKFFLSLKEAKQHKENLRKKNDFKNQRVSFSTRV